MSENCENKNPLKRDGTSQQQRLLKALLPSYVQVDERNLQDLIEFASRYAKLIQYYDHTNTAAGDWQSFFVNQVIDEATKKTEPHYTLFVAFLEILKLAQDDINTITKRHLDFYYKDVLRIAEKPAIPDQVFIIFELAQQVASHLVSKGTALNGGPDATGVDLTYKTDNDIVVNTAQATEFKALFYNKSVDARLYASPVANSANGLGEPIEGEEKQWRTFGNIADINAPFTSPLADRPQAQVGFAFASPVLFLAEGNRSINITLTLANLQNLTTADIQNAFKIMLSGEKNWIEPSASPGKMPGDVTYVGPVGSNTIIIQRTYTTDQDPIVAYNKETLLEPFDTKWPVMKIMLNTQDTLSPYVYNKLKNLVVTNASITVDVDGVKNLVLQNDQSKLNAAKPFMPFGARPVVTSSFYIGSSEIFRKNLSSIDIDITWKGLPTNTDGFKGYYRNYLPAAENAKRKNSGFVTSISMLNGRTWQEIAAAGAPTQLFQPPTLSLLPFLNLEFDYLLGDFRRISVANSALNNIPADPDMPEVGKLDNMTPRGFIKLELENVDFGHSDYQLSYATQAITAARSQTAVIDLPNAPYTPTMSSISLSYVSRASISLVNNAQVNNADAYNNRVEQFFHIQPFGVAEVHPYTAKTTPVITMMPSFNDEGSLYIGISNIVAPQSLSLLIKVAEGSADPDLPKQNVKWSYLSQNEWYEFPKSNILSDSTNGLLTSGIIRLNVPKAITANNSILNSNLFWLKASVTNQSQAICDIIAIHTQAVVAVFENNGNDPNHLRQSLPADTIKELVNSQSAINKPIQPYASFGGAVKEENDNYYTRVSERLRHKNRAVTIWDYERIILEAFPNVYKIKCINHTRYISPNNINEMAPGHVSLAVVSNIFNKNAVNPLKPKTSLLTLSEIGEKVKALNPPCADVHVKNPIYEEVHVKFNVRFYPGFDNGFYVNVLQEDLKKFLAPWAYGETNIVFGQSLHGSVILNFIEEREYVDYVTCFKMDQVTPNGIMKDIEEAVPQTAASILTSAAMHDIEVLETDDCECDDNVIVAHISESNCTCDADIIPPSLPSFGIGVSVIGDNFIVGNGEPIGTGGISEMEIENDFEVE